MESLSGDLLEKILCECSEEQWKIFRESKRYRDKMVAIENKNSTWKRRVDYLIGFESDLEKVRWKNFYYNLINSIPDKDKVKVLRTTSSLNVLFLDCVHKGKNDIVELLIFSPLLDCESHSITLIYSAIEKNNLELIKIFHKSGKMDFIKKDYLIKALMDGKMEIVYYLVDNSLYDIETINMSALRTQIIVRDADILLSKLLKIPKFYEGFKYFARWIHTNKFDPEGATKIRKLILNNYSSEEVS